MNMQQNARKKQKSSWPIQTLKRRLGQLMMIGFDSTYLNKDEISFIKKVDPAGVIYFRRNLDSPEQSLALSQEVWQHFATPPFIGIDQEGGRVERLSKPFTHFPGNQALGQSYEKTQSPKLARQQINAICRQLKSIGVNLDFSPVADIHTNPKNPIINDRAFASTQKTTSNLVGLSVDSFNQNNIISCAKHFPGHGDTLLDSHLALPSVDTSLKTLMQRELKPFIRAIAYKVPMIMTAHIVYSAIDPHNMATLSPFFLQTLLRKRLGYEGLIVSDDLEMHAVAKNKNLSSAAVEALNAGVDLLLVCKSLQESENVYNAIVNALEQKTLDPLRLQASIERVLHCKRRFRLHAPQKNLSQHTWPQHDYLAEKIQKVAN
ncbi:MAG TPA: beta-N-acetylhexosaminidase [Oligoflexia bacterium]|nr:beta-N-acetylhexosaminidase [Oligoflexia bacterium]HMR25185.1 beta-N-acetylhexosaminidase [Oligoflexia bacterium]